MTSNDYPRGALAGLAVLVTRPAEQAEELCARIETAGGQAVRFPLLEIVRTDAPEAALRLLQSLDRWNWLIFVSANAVRHAWDLGDWWRERGPEPRIAAVGRGTAAALARAGCRVDLIPKPQFNSESLLAAPELQAIGGQQILIVRGAGGRELLAEVLRQRGANVTYAEVYRRTAPAGDGAALIAKWRQGEIDVVILTSGEALENLTALLGSADAGWLRSTPLVVFGERLAEMARRAGAERVITAAEASDEALCDALVHNVRAIRSQRTSA